MTTVDTSAEAVERLEVVRRGSGRGLGMRDPRDYSVALSVQDCMDAAATLRALAAERDALADDYRRCFATLQAAYADRDRLAAENARMREALRGLLLVIENDDLIPETVSYMRNARAALTGGKDNG